jgi:hypothetical protein
VTDTTGQVLADYVEEQVELEEKRRASLESRGVGVITVSSTLVTLLFGIAAVVTKSQNFAATEDVRQRLSLALVLFAASSVIAIGTTVPLAIHSVDASALLPEIKALWSKDPEAVRKTTTATRIADLASVQRVNTIKSYVLLAAVAVQVFAVIVLAWSVSDILR